MDKTTQAQARIENVDKQTLFIALLILLEIFSEELPEGKDPNRAIAIKEMIDVLRHRITGLQHEASAMEEAENETAH